MEAIKLLHLHRNTAKAVTLSYVTRFDAKWQQTICLKIFSLQRPIWTLSNLANSRRSSRTSPLGRFLPVATLLSDRPLVGESRHSSKEFICSVRPSLNDRFRLLAALQLFEKLSPRSAATGQKRTFELACQAAINYPS